MPRRLTFVPFVVTASLLLLACDGEYEVVVIAGSDEVLAEGASWELAIVRDGCEDGADRGLPPSGDRLVRTLAWRRGEDGPAVGELDPGRFGFYVRVRDDACTVRWASCADVRAEAGGSGQITIELAGVDGPGCDDGLVCTGEEMCNEDGTCGSVEGSVPACDDSDPCTTDWCEEPGGCRNEPGELDADGDGATCGEDCDDGDDRVAPGRTETCDGRDEDCDEDVDEGNACGGVDDQCIEQTILETTFLACLREVSWPEALSLCARHGGQMSVLYLDEAMLDAVEQFAAVLPPAWWTGINDRTVEGRWDDPDGNPLGYTQWAAGEPDGGASVDCVYFSVPDLGWADGHCDDLHPVICEL